MFELWALELGRLRLQEEVVEKACLDEKMKVALHQRDSSAIDRSGITTVSPLTPCPSPSWSW